jgi:DNA-binding NarL/FixJ family response regulator
MPRKTKKFEQSAVFPIKRTPSASFPGNLSSLVNALFGNKKPYHPTPQQIVDYYITTREREIVYLALLDFSDQEIAEALGLSAQTVRLHLRNLMLKLQVEDIESVREYFLDRGRTGLSELPKD